MKIINSTVPEQYSAFRIDSYLASRFTYLSRHAWQKMIKGGSISINDITSTSHSKKVNAGDTVTFKTAQNEEPAVDDRYSIAFEDDYVIAVNKSGNLPVHPAGRFYRNTLLTLLQIDRYMKLYPLHRLDRETSGIVLFAKDGAVASAMQNGFNAKVSKNYLAVTHGNMKRKELAITVPIGRDYQSPIRKKRAAYADAEEHAATNFIELASSREYSVVKATPFTGRLHQIRVHANYAGMPILGDKLYGIDEKMYLHFIEHGTDAAIMDKLKFHRTALHAHKISFIHPVSSEKITITADMPDDMKTFIRNNIPDFYG